MHHCGGCKKAGKESQGGPVKGNVQEGAEKAEEIVVEEHKLR
jgi:hypothetical protein